MNCNSLIIKLAIPGIVISMACAVTTVAQINWKSASDKKIVANSYAKAVVFNNKMWSIAGIGIGTEVNEVWNSADGITWEKVSNSYSLPMKRDFGLVAFKGHLYIIGGTVAA